MGNRTNVTDATSRTVTFVYDSLNRLTEERDALAHSNLYGYDAAGRKTSTTDPNNRMTRYSYDGLGHLTYVTDAAGGVVSYQYDGAGNRTAMVDANLHQTAYTFDGLNRIRTETDPETRLTTTTYDDLASRVTINRPDNTSVVKQLDELGRTGTITYPDQTVSYVYDAASQLQIMTDGTGTTTYGYDGAGRVTSVASPQGTLGYGYDAAGRRNRIDYPGSRSVNYTFDPAGRMATVTDWATKQAIYGYDDAGRKTSQTNPNGTSSSFSYDGAGRLTGIAHLSGLTTIASFTYTPDPAGNPLSVAEVMSLIPGGTTSYAYDSLDRLTSANYPGGTFATYQYDAMGNRTQLDTTRNRKGTTTYSYDRSDRLTSSSGAQAFSFSWDGRGNETAKGTSSFGYDSANRLTSANTGGTASTYAYNGEGVRVGKTVGGTTTTYLQDAVGGLPKVLLESTAGQETLFVYGNGLAWEVRPDGTHRYYHADSLGSTRVVTDDAGTAVSAYSYDAYGAVRASAGEAKGFTFTGEQTDPETSLEFLRARSYDPATGRFLQRDGVRGNSWDGRTLNRYAYALDDPTARTDPSGDFAPLVVAVLTSPEWGPVAWGALTIFAYEATVTIQQNSDAIYDAADAIKSGVEGVQRQICSARESVVESRNNWREQLGLLPHGGWQGMHVIPKQWENHPAIKKAEEVGWDHWGKENGLGMPGSEATAREAERKYYHRGSHQEYSEKVRQALDEIQDRADKEGLSAEHVKAEVEALARKLKEDLSAGNEESADPERVR